MNCKPKKILLVDDEKMTKMALDMVFLAPMYQIYYCKDVPTAITFLTTHKDIDLVLLDLFISDISGYKLLEVMAAKGIKIPTIILSAKDSAQSVVEAFKRGAVDYITKPFDSKQIFLRAEEALQNHKTKTG